jgi:ribosomal protein L29
MNKFTVFENTGKEKNTTKASNIRRDIAQILTVIKERQSSKS